MPDYITDPDLLRQLEGNTPQAPTQAPAQAPAPSGPAYITDPAILAQLEGRPNPNATPEAPWGNGVQAGVTSALNTGSLNAYRNALAAVTYGLGKIGVEGYPNESFENHYQKWKRYDDEVAAQNPKSALAGTVAGVGGAALAAPYVLPEAGMAALYSGGVPAVLRSAAVGAGTAGTSQLLDDHDLKKAGTAAIAGGVAGPVADKVVNVAKPFWRNAQTLTPREIDVAGLTRQTIPGTPASWANGAMDFGKQAAGAAAGAYAGHAIGGMLPTEYGDLGGATIGGIAGRQVAKAYQTNRDGLAGQGMYYQKGNRGAALVGAAIPQVFNGLLGP